MDGLLAVLHDDVICQGGREGVAAGQFWELAARRYSQLYGRELEASGRQYLWGQAIASGLFVYDKGGKSVATPELDTSSLTSNHTVGTTEVARLAFYTAGRPLKFNDVQRQTLELLAKAGPAGVTQAKVAKSLSMDPRSFFHQLKSLLEWRIIVKLPVSYQRSFTYLLYLTRFAPADEDILTGLEMDDSTQSVPSVVSIRSWIMDLLQSAPQRTLPATEVYRLLGDPRHVRIYRRNINWLVCHGFIDCFIAGELGGVAGKILRWKKPLSDVRAASKKRGEVETIDRPRFSAITTFSTLERQVHDYVDRSGKAGVTLSDVMWDFGVGRKLAYRLGERLTNAKIHPDSEVIKIPEFLGKERRHRFFTRSGQMRNKEGGQGRHGDGSGDEDVTLLGSAVRDSVTRTKRLKALLDIVNEEVVIESGKPLASSLQRRLAETNYTMDTKTLKRLIGHLEAQGQLRTIIVALANVNKTVLMKADLTPDDPRVTGYIENMRRNRADVSTPPPPPPPLPTASTSMEGMAGAGVAKEHKYQMQKYGYVFGVLARCRLLHTYLMREIILPRGNFDGEETWLCETLPAFFRSFPLDLFLRIVGVGEMSASMRTYLEDPIHRSVHLENLPADVKEEIHRRRVDRHKTVIKRLMEMLAQLGLAAPDNRYPSVAFRLPFQFRLSRMASVLAAGGKVARALDLTLPEMVDEYWSWLESLSADDGARMHDDGVDARMNDNVVDVRMNDDVVDVRMNDDVVDARMNDNVVDTRINYDRATKVGDDSATKVGDDNFTKVGDDNVTRVDDGWPSIYKLAAQKESWQAVSPFSRAFRKALRRTLHSAPPPDQLDVELDKLAEDFEIERESVRRAYTELEEDVARNRSARVAERRARRDTKRVRVQRHIEPRPDEGERRRKAVLHTFAADELEAIRVAFFCLQLPQFRSTTGTLQWSLVESLYRRDVIAGMRVGEELRGMIQRFLNSGDQSRRMRRVEHLFRVIDAYCTIGVIRRPDAPSDNVEAQFEATFLWYQDTISTLGKAQEAVRAHQQQQIRELADITERIYLDGGASVFDPESHMKRMSRAQQQRQFSLISPVIPRGAERTTPITTEWTAIRRMLAIPVREYDALRAREHLSQYDQTLIDSTLEAMVQAGLLAHGESNKYRARIPGSEYHVHERFCTLIEGSEWPENGAKEEFVDALRGAARGETKLTYEMTRGSAPKVIIANRAIGKGSAERVASAIERTLGNGGGRRDAVWFRSDGNLAVPIVTAACRMVYEEIVTRPGIGLTNLWAACWPILTPDEVEACLDILQHARIVDVEFQQHYFPL